MADDIIPKYVFGPVPSRRFGRSLGVNPLPRKTCNYSCIYCQLGRTVGLQSERSVLYPTDDVVDDVRAAVENVHGQLDYITFMGDGEPTLAANLGDMVKGVREFWKGKMALITNGSLFHLPEVREAVALFDVIAPTISAGDEETFRKMHRPPRSLKLETVLNGLRLLRQEFSGEIWGELILIHGVNDTISSLQDIRKAVQYVGVDRLYINVPIRPPAENWVKPPDDDFMKQVFNIFPEAVDMTCPEEGSFTGNQGERDELVEIAKNHPLREDQALSILCKTMNEDAAQVALLELVEQGKLQIKSYSGVTFYSVPLKKKQGRL